MSLSKYNKRKNKSINLDSNYQSMCETVHTLIGDIAGKVSADINELNKKRAEWREEEALCRKLGIPYSFEDEQNNYLENFFAQHRALHTYADDSESSTKPEDELGETSHRNVCTDFTKLCQNMELGKQEERSTDCGKSKSFEDNLGNCLKSDSLQQTAICGSLESCFTPFPVSDGHNFNVSEFDSDYSDTSRETDCETNFTSASSASDKSFLQACKDKFTNVMKPVVATYNVLKSLKEERKTDSDQSEQSTLASEEINETSDVLSLRQNIGLKLVNTKSTSSKLSNTCSPQPRRDSKESPTKFKRPDEEDFKPDETVLEVFKAEARRNSEQTCDNREVYSLDEETGFNGANKQVSESASENIHIESEGTFENFKSKCKNSFSKLKISSVKTYSFLKSLKKDKTAVENEVSCSEDSLTASRSTLSTEDIFERSCNLPLEQLNNFENVNLSTRCSTSTRSDTTESQTKPLRFENDSGPKLQSEMQTNGSPKQTSVKQVSSPKEETGSALAKSPEKLATPTRRSPMMGLAALDTTTSLKNKQPTLAKSPEKLATPTGQIPLMGLTLLESIKNGQKDDDEPCAGSKLENSTHLSSTPKVSTDVLRSLYKDAVLDYFEKIPDIFANMLENKMSLEDCKKQLLYAIHSEIGNLQRSATMSASTSKKGLHQ